MTTNENAAQDPKNQDFSFKSCQDMMMKMMSRFMEGKGEKFDFKKMCGNMADCCKGMMKAMDEKNKEKGAQS